MAKLLSEFPEGLDVMDVPVGTGRFLELYTQRGDRFFGVDISRDMIQIANKETERFPDLDVRFAVRPAHKLPVVEESIDLLVSCRFFGMLTPDYGRKVMKEFSRVLRAGGTVILYSSYSDAPSETSAEIGANVIGNFSEARLRDFLSGEGFKVVSKYPIESDSSGNYAFFTLVSV